MEGWEIEKKVNRHNFRYKLYETDLQDVVVIALDKINPDGSLRPNPVYAFPIYSIYSGDEEIPGLQKNYDLICKYFEDEKLKVKTIGPEFYKELMDLYLGKEPNKTSQYIKQQLLQIKEKGQTFYNDLSTKLFSRDHQ